jgi:hypothetical protein
LLVVVEVDIIQIPHQIQVKVELVVVVLVVMEIHHPGALCRLYKVKEQLVVEVVAELIIIMELLVGLVLLL